MSCEVVDIYNKSDYDFYHAKFDSLVIRFSYNILVLVSENGIEFLDTPRQVHILVSGNVV